MKEKKGSHQQNTNVIVPFHPTYEERHFSLRLVLAIVACWLRSTVIVVFLLVLVLPYSFSVRNCRMDVTVAEASVAAHDSSTPVRSSYD
jgi:hypothetical protein